MSVLTVEEITDSYNSLLTFLNAAGIDLTGQDASFKFTNPWALADMAKRYLAFASMLEDNMGTDAYQNLINSPEDFANPEVVARLKFNVDTTADLTIPKLASDEVDGLVSNMVLNYASQYFEVAAAHYKAYGSLCSGGSTAMFLSTMFKDYGTLKDFKEYMFSEFNLSAVDVNGLVSEVKGNAENYCDSVRSGLNDSSTQNKDPEPEWYLDGYGSLLEAMYNAYYQDLVVAQGHLNDRSKNERFYSPGINVDAWKRMWDRKNKTAAVVVTTGVTAIASSVGFLIGYNEGLLTPQDVLMGVTSVSSLLGVGISISSINSESRTLGKSKDIKQFRKSVNKDSTVIKLNRSRWLSDPDKGFVQ